MLAFDEFKEGCPMRRAGEGTMVFCRRIRRDCVEKNCSSYYTYCVIMESVIKLFRSVKKLKDHCHYHYTSIGARDVTFEEEDR